jgi:ATP phosphoribosyltransferase
MGVSGKDVILEHGGEGFYEPLDLQIARCRLMTAGMKDVPLKTGRIRVATKFVNIARRYYAEQGRQVDVVKLYGAMELAPLMGLADEIVDIVDTGNTLRANGLEARDVIAPITSRLIVNKAAMKTQHAQLQPIIDALTMAVTKRSNG